MEIHLDKGKECVTNKQKKEENMLNILGYGIIPIQNRHGHIIYTTCKLNKWHAQTINHIQNIKPSSLTICTRSYYEMVMEDQGVEMR